MCTCVCVYGSEHVGIFFAHLWLLLMTACLPLPFRHGFSYWQAQACSIFQAPYIAPDTRVSPITGKVRMARDSVFTASLVS